jgi:monooxygenase
MRVQSFDVIVVGAGLSGIDAGYHLQTRCPGMSYAILEGRDRLGGTWDLFKYPGIRSDSDMYTLGFPFHPWKDPKAIADGPAILAYLEETAAKFGIDKRIQLGVRVTSASWDGGWTVETSKGTMKARFLFLCAGYYDCAGGYTPAFEGAERFRGTIVHPQAWTPDLDYAGKRVVVIGSGATAVTLVPAMAAKAAHVTMLQRSPTYVMSRPAKDPLEGKLSARAMRWKSVLLGMAFYAYCRRFPRHASNALVKGVGKHLGRAATEQHFTPSYDPWDQRLCLVPDADLFAALKSGAASVVTDHIASLDETGILLRSGAHLDADLIVTATGLVLRPMGGIAISVHGKPVELSDTMTYKGMMLSGVPNLAFAVGYTNASWTLKCDLTSRYVCRLLNHMAKHGFTACTPHKTPGVAEEPLLDFTSGYVQRAIHQFPKAGSVSPWKLYQNYALDLLMLGYGKLTDAAMRFS